MYLTKTDFVHYLHCSRSLWLLKHNPDAYPRKAFSDFLKKILREGYEVEAYAQLLFPDGVMLPTTGVAAVEKTCAAFTEKTKTLFQATVHTDDGLFARADILTRGAGDAYTLYEVKSSSSIKRDAKRDHIKDACFQKIAFERSGIRIEKVFIIHTNGDYVREVEIDPHALLQKTDITEMVQAVYDETEVEINNALSFLKEETIEENECRCFRKTRSNHCDAFEYFNGPLPERSVWEIGNIREKKLCTMLERNIRKMEDVDETIALNDRQSRQVRSAKEHRPLIDEEKINALFDTLEFPLHFFDYEAASSAVPKLVGVKPWQHIPFQYSLHKLDADGTLEHYEYLHETFFDHEKILRKLCDAFEANGSVISWHASYEKTINKDMMHMYPAYQEILQSINDRMFDLEDIFKEAYMDAAFCGSTSIKKILPILCPNLSYEHLAVQDGGQAMEQWFTLVEEEDAQKRSAIASDLLAYCKLDTFAMLELYQAIKRLV